MDPHTSQDALPLCVIKNLVSARLYSAPQLHLIFVIILGIAAALLEIMCHPPKKANTLIGAFPDAS
jgi:hypothetical protein